MRSAKWPKSSGPAARPPRPHPPYRPGAPVCRRGVPPRAPGPCHDPQHVAQGRPLRQCVRGELLQHVKNELVHHTTFHTRDEARAAIFEYIEALSRYAGDSRLLCQGGPAAGRCPRLTCPRNPGYLRGTATSICGASVPGAGAAPGTRRASRAPGGTDGAAHPVEGLDRRGRVAHWRCTSAIVWGITTACQLFLPGPSAVGTGPKGDRDPS